jgi:LmbE family N-acetylglucosaminyl deacetylase
MKILVIVAHCDDETLGCGGTIAKHVDMGDDVYCFVMTDNYRSPEIAEHFKNAMDVLGVKSCQLLQFGDMQLEKYTIWELSQRIEEYLKKIGVPDIIYTHYENDLSQDHKLTYQATVTALRPIWGKPFSLYSFDTASSTEWSGKPIEAHMFVDISKYMDKKLKAFNCYKTEIREYPHPRSCKALESRAIYWGTHCEMECAEAFQVIREVR